ncbi:SGNH/GDSL hydrolase family protein [Nocardioides pacificus]
MTFHRYVALGDSFTEGVGDPDPARPNGLRGWADRVAEVLASRTEDFGYANLAIRGRKLDGIIAEQIEPAIALRPDLITIYAGANDILRPKVDLDALVERYDAALGRLAATGAHLVVWTATDPGGSAIYRPVRGRFAIYNELVREAADRHGATILDYWRLREYRDWRLWDTDRMHMGPAGHQRMAIAVLDALGVSHDLEPLPLVDVVAPVGRAKVREDVTWAREFAAPWVHRRITGRSSGDTVSARHPRLARLEHLLGERLGERLGEHLGDPGVPQGTE